MTDIAAVRPEMSRRRDNLPRDLTQLREPPGLRLPENITAEQAVLGSLLCDNAGYRAVRGILVADDFAWTAHQRIYDAISTLIEAGEPANPVTMAHLFDTDLDVFEGSEPGRYLVKLAQCAVTLTGNQRLARLVRDLALRRRLMAEFEECRPLEEAVDILDRHREHLEAQRRSRRGCDAR